MHGPRTGTKQAEAGSVRDRLDEILGSGSDAETALVGRMVSGFPGKSAQLLTAALTAAEAGDGPTAGQWIHRLNGAAANLGALEVPRLCEQVERLALADDCDGVAAHRAALQAAVAALLPLLAEAWSGAASGAAEGG